MKYSFDFNFFAWMNYITNQRIKIIILLAGRYTDASGIKNSLDHVVRIFSGTLVPIYLFPENIKAFVKLSPFPAMIYSTANALTTDFINRSVVQELSVAVFWSFVMGILSYKFWVYSIKKYEAVGI